MNKHQKSIFLSLVFISMTLPALADGPEELGKFIFNVVIGFVVFVVGLIFLFWFFRKDHKFIGFTVINLIVFIFILLYVLGRDFREDRGDTWFLNVVIFQILAQLIYIAKAAVDKIYKKKKSEDENN